MEAGESVTEACIREVWEETGLYVAVSHLLGVYSTPDWLIVYADGNRYQAVSLTFIAIVEDGELTTSDETTAAGYFSQDEIAEMDVIETHQQRIADAFASYGAPTISPIPYIR